MLLLRLRLLLLLGLPLSGARSLRSRFELSCAELICAGAALAKKMLRWSGVGAALEMR